MDDFTTTLTILKPIGVGGGTSAGWTCTGAAAVVACETPTDPNCSGTPGIECATNWFHTRASWIGENWYDIWDCGSCTISHFPPPPPPPHTHTHRRAFASLTHNNVMHSASNVSYSCGGWGDTELCMRAGQKHACAEDIHVCVHSVSRMHIIHYYTNVRKWHLHNLWCKCIYYYLLWCIEVHCIYCI